MYREKCFDVCDVKTSHTWPHDYDNDDDDLQWHKVKGNAMINLISTNTEDIENPKIKESGS